MRGASALLSTLREHGSFHCAIATGAWRASALLKIRCAGLNIDELPIATGDDSPSREGILQAAFERARSIHGLPSTCDVVAVGDGVWDLRAAKAMGWRFLGVGQGKQAETLSSAGAGQVVEDFTDVERVLRLLA